MLTQQTKNLDDPPVSTGGLAEKFLWLVCILVCLAAVLLMANDGFLLKRFTPVADGLSEIAIVNDLHGKVSKKTVLDSMWLPILKANSVFNSDQLETGLGSEAEVQVGDKSTVLVKENTKVRLSKIDDEINFRLSHGEVQLNALIDQNIRIQRGADTETLSVKRGFYIIKIDPVFGVLLQSTTAPPKFEKTGKIKNKIAKSKAVEEVKIKTVKNDGKEDPPQPETTRKKLSYDLPLPKEATVFLGYKQQEIIVAARRTCPDVCNLTIFRNHQLWKAADFKTGEQSVVRLPPLEMNVGTYDWIFSTETAEFRSRFVVKDFSDDEFQKAIENKIPVEIQ